MLYLAIDQHKSQLTINVRNEYGDVIQKGQISTKHDEINDFFGKFAKKARKVRGFMAIVEVGSFNDWLLEKLKKLKCNEIVVIQPDQCHCRRLFSFIARKISIDRIGIFC